ncbi:MAG: 4-hydroxythreonine-4-phosphate dehydrogenase PdxA [Bacteroidales bacterium]|jgi:4-hydroxythreonine-4-phosphate dehydrogenase|nr:4-hydroxythreonine-4-phosphate dehydrogenase PdxA [Bacteroidales bacterium]MDD3702517.1 4-hydroxythreonine-4-phosphate dehydrogenase PdxA [Bacteroidales bacterium]MDY0368445.1 4-hydroxythreonine-4-phosphate dehydrogenase PdxA [Bacteroidales bacterium]
METVPSSGERIRVGITHGDINGINYEIIIKVFNDARMLDFFTPVIYGHSRVASFYRKSLQLGDTPFNLIKDASLAHTHRINIINITENDLLVQMGSSTELAGEAAFKALEMAVSDLKNNLIDVLVTAPINKQNIQSAAFSFPGHTEYLASRFDAPNPLMLMVWESLRIGTVTGHVPLASVPTQITSKLIIQKLSTLHHSLFYDFGIQKPKIAVLGLNPHAGDGGLLGQEEKEVIFPALNTARKEHDILAFGPFSADGFFGTGHWKQYDAVLAMYHDQGLIPFKSIAFEDGVNFTAGLPFIRTSPAHGTAYELAGKNQASEASFRQAIYLALDTYRNRRHQIELEQNALKPAQESNE